MVKTPSTMAALGTDAPNFSLPDPKSGDTVSLGDFADSPALLVAFLSNHCPFVKHLADELGDFSRGYSSKGLAIVGICSNDVANYPDDSPQKMADEVEATRDTPSPISPTSHRRSRKAFEAACTPDFFLYDADRKLVYRGQFDDSRPAPWTCRSRGSRPPGCLRRGPGGPAPVARSNDRASAATSSGRRATRRTVVRLGA